MENFISAALYGLFQPSPWVYLVYTLIMTHITIMSVTIYFHRTRAHLALDVHPRLALFFRTWIWATTGMNDWEWVAIHRYHHARDDGLEDPHSPWVYGIWYVLFFGVVLYYKAAGKVSVMKHCLDHKKDWIEVNVFSSKLPFAKFYGVALMLLINVVLFGWIGAVIWVVQMLWIPFWAAGVINGLGHWPMFRYLLGYRNTETKDHSSNIVPLGAWIGGEELHNNHHTYPKSAKFSIKWYEFDLGWVYIRLFQMLGWAKVKYIYDEKVKYEDGKYVVVK